jgi:uncharacterized BrkB/YihY/UPF0761 family membrane protein
MLPAYCYGWMVLTDPSTSFQVIRSQVTVVFLAFLVMFALWLSRITKPMPKWKGWLVWALAMAVFILVFKYLGGFQTNVI